MKKLVILGISAILALTGCSLVQKDDAMKVIDSEQALNLAGNFINNYLVDPDKQVLLNSIEVISGLYQIKLTLTDGSNIEAYMTKDGEYFFTEGYNVEKFKAEKDQEIKDAKAAASAVVGIAILKEGLGEQIVGPTSTVTVNYEGRFEDGTIFDSSYQKGKPVNFPLGQNQVIMGWERGLQGMKIGEKRRLTIPPALGYGSKGNGGIIPPDTTLIFDVELISLEN